MIKLLIGSTKTSIIVSSTTTSNATKNSTAYVNSALIQTKRHDTARLIRIMK